MTIVRSVRLGVFSAVASCLFSFSSSWAQQETSPAPVGQSAPPGYSTTVFKANVRRVVLDVVVTDSKGQAVHGLTKEDFFVAEDGKPQQILSFDANGFGQAMDYVPPKLPPEPPNTFVNL